MIIYTSWYDSIFHMAIAKIESTLQPYITYTRMSNLSDNITIKDPSCCYRKATRASLEINLLENGLYGLYVAVMLGVFCMFNNIKGIYICATFLVIILGSIYSIKREIRAFDTQELHIDTSADSDTESESADALTDGSILEDFKKAVNLISEEKAVSEALNSATAVLEEKELNYRTAITSEDTAALEYDRVAREYTEIEQIIQTVAAEYRLKASNAREAAKSKLAEKQAEDEADEAEAEARADAAYEREYNED